jgi:acetyltransferase-like isoleucine patch superfamily enzyme
VNRLTRFFTRQAQNWRQRTLRRTFARLGAGPGCATLKLCGRRPFLDVTGRIELGSGVIVRCLTRLTSITVGPDAFLHIGAYSFLNQGGNFAVTCGITLGDRCLVAEDVSFFDTNYHEVDQGAGVYSAPIVIGRNVWISHGAVILPGTRLGNHSVVAAGAVVRGEFPARSLVGGVPARLIRTLDCADDFLRS